MSNTAHFTQITEPELLDVVDDAWLQDKLPDDSVPLPQGMQIFVEELDEQQEQRPPVKQKERWLDLGLHQLH